MGISKVVRKENLQVGPADLVFIGQMAKLLRATPSAAFPAQEKSGQFMCYETGQF